MAADGHSPFNQSSSVKSRILRGALYWQLTCRAFHSPEEWELLLGQAGYTGDYGCIYFE